MRLGFYHHISILPKDNELFIIGHMGRFLDGLAKYCDELTVFMHESKNPDPFHDYHITSKNIRWVNMGPRRSAPFFTVFGKKYRRIVRGYLNEIDVLLLRGPSPLLPELARLNKSIPIALLLGGDYLAGVESLPQPFWRKTLIRVWAQHYNRSQLRVAKNCLTMVNSQKLFEELKPKLINLFETKTTTLTENDFYWREDTCKKEPIRLLYTGRMDRAKGLLDILEAVRILVEQGLDIIFDLVGMLDPGDSVLEILMARAKEQGLSDRVQYHGYKSVGPDLFDYYKKSDIYVIASQTSFEGFPRTIWEALAHCLPVVSTKVGSIPYFLSNEENALLVEPKSISGLVDAISRVIKDQDLRMKIIRNGFLLPKQNTVEIRSQEMINEIEKFVHQWKDI